MSKSNLKTVSAARVREAFNKGEFNAPDAALPSLLGGSLVKGVHVPGNGVVRGRLSPAAVEAFNSQVTGEVYGGEKSAAESKSVTLPLTKQNAKGANLKRPEAFPLSEVRRLAGVEGKKGRLSAAEVATATAAVIASRGWDKPATKSAPKGRTVNPAAPVA